MRITVSYADFISAGIVGFLRVVSLLNRRIEPNGTTAQIGDPVFDQGINGAVAEYLVAQLLNLSWAPKIGETSKGDIGGGAVEVRCRNTLVGRDLGIRNHEQKAVPYVLVLYHGFLDFEIVGWIYGHEAVARGGVWNDKRQCFFVPAPYRSMEELARLIVKKEIAA